MTLVRRSAVPIALAVGGLAVAAGPALAAPSAEVVVQPRPHDPSFNMTIDNASSVANAFAVTNTSTAGESIESVTFDLSTGDFPHMVFTPDNEAGDVNPEDPDDAQPFALGFPEDPPTTEIDPGIVSPSFLPAAGVPRGGFDTLQIDFDGDPDFPDSEDNEFAPGFSMVFRVDVDPNSINGTPVSSSPAGPVSGAELQGATVTVVFSDGPSLSSTLSYKSGTDPEGIGAQAIVNQQTSSAPAPGLARAGGATSTTVASDTDTASETVLVTGQPGQTGIVVVADAHLNTTGAGSVPMPNLLPANAPVPPTPDPLEVNTAKAFRETPFTIGPNGTAEVDVQLSNTPKPEEDPVETVITGRNVITAFRTDVGSPGKTSTPLVLELDEGGDTTPPGVTAITPQTGATGVAIDTNVSVQFSEPMDTGTLEHPGTITVAPQGGGPVAAAVSAGAGGTEATVDPTADLAPGTTYVVTTTTNARDLAGNGLPADATATFTTEEAPPSPPAPGPGAGSPPSAGAEPGPAPGPALAAAPTSGDAVCNPVPERGTSRRGRVTYSASALKIQQNIDSAVLRRLNAINAWIDAGIVQSDLCASAFGPEAFQAGMSFTGGGSHEASPPTPRAIEIRRPSTRRGQITRSRRQLVINERIGRALDARARATLGRISSLTGGNLAPGTALSGRAVWPGLTASGPQPRSVDGPATELRIGSLPRAIPIRENAATVRAQQRRSQRSIVIANRALDAIRAGLTSENFASGSIGSGRL